MALFFLYCLLSFFGPLLYALARILWSGEKPSKDTFLGFFSFAAETGEMFIVIVSALFWPFFSAITGSFILLYFSINKFK
jgi:hypothetical protein